MRSLFITGATGFIGRRLMRRLDPDEYRAMTCLMRPGVTLDAEFEGGRPRSCARIVRGDLRHPDSYLNALAECDTVIHLGAATGRAAAQAFQAVNAEGTEALVRACAQSGVRDFLLVSTIAVTYADKRHYPYAQSKERAEQVLRESSLRFAIVRPTIVIGADAPIWKTLVRMARPRVILMPGTGRARIQPIHVDDMVASLITMMRGDRFERQTVELGGADVVSFEEFLRRVHRLRTGREPAVVHLPLGAISTTLSWLERIVGSRLPVTAGQLSAFANDSVVDPRLSPAAGGAVRGVDEIIRDCGDA